MIGFLRPLFLIIFRLFPVLFRLPHHTLITPPTLPPLPLNLWSFASCFILLIVVVVVVVVVVSVVDL